MKMSDLIYARGYYVTDKVCGDKYHHSRIVEALKAENEELKAKLDKAKWQLIETAPAYTDILVMFMAEGKYQKCQVAYYINWNHGRFYTDWKWTIPPTHWMPLPKPPTMQEGE